MLEAAAGTVGGKVNGISPAEWLLQTASQYNITVLRLLATGVTDELPLQTSANVYNEVALKALDQVLDWAAKHKARANAPRFPRLPSSSLLSPPISLRSPSPLYSLLSPSCPT